MTTGTTNPRMSLAQWQSYFDVGDHTIRFTASTLSGTERVHVDEQLVCQQLSWKLYNEHHFKVDGSPYVLKLFTLSLLHQKFRLELHRAGQLIDSDDIAWGTHYNISGFAAMAFLFGLVGGMVAGYFLYPSVSAAL